MSADSSLKSTILLALRSWLRLDNDFGRAAV
jgi:hypothetical protein